GEAPSPTPEPLPPTPPSGGGSQGDVTPPFRAGVETCDEQLTTTENVTSNGTSATPENNPKPATDLTPAQNDNTELSTKDIATQCDIPAPKPTGRKVMSRSVEFRYTPKDRI